MKLARKVGRPGAPRAPTFKQVIIDKGKNKVEGLKIHGSLATGNRTSTDELLSSSCMEDVMEESARKDEISLEQPSLGLDPQRNVADLSNTVHQGPDLGRSRDSGENSGQLKYQGRCKPKALDSLRVVITDPDLQDYRDHMAVYAVIDRKSVV